MRYLLDTGIIGSITKPSPPPSLLAWMTEQKDDDLYISALTVAEIRRAILERPTSKRRDELEDWFVGPGGPPALFAGRVLPFDEAAALIWARFMTDGKSSRRGRSGLDTIIAAIAEANGCIVVTDKEEGFVGVEIINPMRKSRS